jgi:hypothetical protein
MLAGTLLVCVALRHHQILTQQEQPFGHYTQQQILDRTLPLCRTVLGQTDGLMLSTERARSTASDGRTRLWWNLKCANKAGEVLAMFLWDAETGDLAFAVHNAWTSPEQARASGAAASGSRTPEQARGRAAWLSYRWLSRLGILGQGGWRLTQEPERSARRSEVWYTQWRSSDHEAMVQVDVGSGELVSAHSRPLSAPTRLRAQ